MATQHSILPFRRVVLGSVFFERVRNSVAEKYLFSCFIVLFVAVLQKIFWSVLDPFAFAIFFPAIILSALVGGFAAGTFATAFSVLIVRFTFMGSAEGMLARTDLVRIVAFSSNALLVAGVTSYLFEKYRELARQSLDEMLLRMGDGFVSLDKALTYLYVNDKAARYMGFEREKILGKTVLEIYPELKGTRLLADMHSVVSDEIHTNCEFFSTATNRWFDIQLYPTHSGLSIYFREITDKKLAEEQLQQSAEEAIASNAQLVKLNAELRRSNDELAQFAHVASHDMKEPLRMISTYIQLLDVEYGPKLEGDAKVYMRFATEGAKRMYTLINDVLSYSRVSSDLNDSPLVPMEQAIKEAVDNLQFVILESHAKIHFGTVPAVNVPERPFVQVVQNLLSNAVKFHREGIAPEISLSYTERDGYWLVRIQDNGIGVESTQKGQIFDLFKRLNPQSLYPGTGIGLALCKRIVDHWGGLIWVEPAEEQGSIFQFTFPKAMR